MTSVLSVLLSLLIFNINQLLLLMLMMLLAFIVSEVGPHGQCFGEHAVSVRFATGVQVECSANASAMQLTMVWFRPECDAHQYKRC